MKSLLNPEIAIFSTKLMKLYVENQFTIIPPYKYL